jgi:hypothetical protein
LNNPTIGSAEASIILEETADGNTARNNPRKRMIDRDHRNESKKRRRRNDAITPLPRHTLCMSEQHGHDSLNVEGRIGIKTCLVTIDKEASVTPGHHRRTARERPVHTVRPANYIRGDPLHPEGHFSKTDLETAPTNDFGVRRQYY